MPCLVKPNYIDNFQTNGRLVVVQCNLSGSQVSLASVCAPAEGQERTPFFQGNLLSASLAGTPLALRGHWNCVANDQDLIGVQPRHRSVRLSAGVASPSTWRLQDAFRHLHRHAWELTHTATSRPSSARIDRVVLCFRAEGEQSCIHCKTQSIRAQTE